MYCDKLFLSIILTISLVFTGFTNAKVEVKKETIETVVNYKQLNVPKYKFTDNVIKDAYIFQYKDFKISQPYKQSNKQVLTYNQVAEEFQGLPKILTQNVNEIQLLDYSNKKDKYWAETYGMKNFKSYAKGGNKQIYFYANSHISEATNNSYFKTALVHELAHNFDESISSAENRYSSSNEWVLIMGEDFDIKDNGFGLYSSQYAQDASSSIEDFAESIVQYITDKENFINNYPNRTKKINELGIR